MPYSRLQTDFRDMSNRPFNGSMLAVLNSPIKLPEGVEILNQRFEYPVKDGVAYDDDSLTVLAELPATASATPDDTLVSIFLKDASGRLFYHGSFVIPEMTNNEPIALASLSNQDPSGGVVLNVASIGGLTGTILLEGQFSIEADTNTLIFHGLRYKGPWDGDSSFAEGDVVRYDDKLWVANRESQGSQPAPSADWSLFLEPPPIVLPEPTGINWRNAWQTGTTYRELDAVEYGGQAYVCLQVHQAAASNAPADGSTYWKLFAAKGIGINWQGAYDAARTYKKGDAIQYQGSSYYATADMPANNPPGSSQAPLPAGNVALGNAGSVVGTGSTAGLGPELAFDGDANTYWEASTSSGYYDTAGLANVWGGVLREVTQVVIRQHATEYFNKVGGILIEHTTDGGVTWQDTVAGVQGIPNGGFGEQTVNLPAPVKCNGMRVKAGANTTSGGSAYKWRVYELKFMANALPGAPLWDLIASKGADGADAGNLALDDLTDVDLTGATDGQVLKRQGGVWVPAADDTGSGGGGATALADLSDVNVASPSDGQVLKYDAATSSWIAADDETAAGGGGASALDDLTDVDLTTTAPADGDVLTYDATAGEWVPQAPPAGGGSEAYLQLLVSATRTTTLALAADGSQSTVVAFDTATTNVGNAYNTSTGVFTAPAAGEYLVAAHLEIKRNSAGSNNIGAGVRKNSGAAYWQGKYPQSGELAWQAAQEWTWRVTLAQNDTLDVVARSAQASTIQNDGASQGALGTSRCALKVYRLS